MKEAFIFDMDGVIINSETTWEKYGSTFYIDLLGKDIAEKVGDAMGLSLPAMYDAAVSYGFKKAREEFYEAFDRQAKFIYEKAPITPGFSEFVSFLQSENFQLGIVSASPQHWIDMTLHKTTVSHMFEYVLSLHDRNDLRHKPAPDGFLEAMRVLHVTPRHTLILEDSNRGIQAAKTSGAFTIGFRQHLPKNYEQSGADVYAKNLKDVQKIVMSKMHTRSTKNL